ncbi:MAG: PQ-loop repeat-containing protein [Bacilli bacterium]|jgi:uncharacterized protein with PQ loop repeat|nr:PQ-loop repeat-containing protein [Bacilli bacterium]
MEFTYLDIIGLIAGAVLAISAIPQLIKVIADKDTRSMSFYMILLLFTGNVLWLTYGICGHFLSMIISNCISSTLYLVLVLVKLIHIIQKKDKLEHIADLFKSKKQNETEN